MRLAHSGLPGEDGGMKTLYSTGAGDGGGEKGGFADQRRRRRTRIGSGKEGDGQGDPKDCITEGGMQGDEHCMFQVQTGPIPRD